MELITALMELEAAAAKVGRLLPDSEEGLQQVLDAWGPLMPRTYSTARWSAFWIAWLRDCGDRIPVGEGTDLT